MQRDMLMWLEAMHYLDDVQTAGVRANAGQRLGAGSGRLEAEVRRRVNRAAGRVLPHGRAIDRAYRLQVAVERAKEDRVAIDGGRRGLVLLRLSAGRHRPDLGTSGRIKALLCGGREIKLTLTQIN